MTDTPKLWRDMTREEKGALLLAHHEGKVIEFKNPKEGPHWRRAKPEWADWCAYRVKPEPVRDTFKLHGGSKRKGLFEFSEGAAIHNDTHQITFDTIDGEPDCASIKMVKL